MVVKLIVGMVCMVGNILMVLLFICSILFMVMGM